MSSVFFKFHSVEVTVKSHLSAIEESARHDFRFFLQPRRRAGKRALQIEIKPLESKVGRWVPVWKGARSTIYLSRRGAQKVRFFGDTYVSYSYHGKSCRIYSDDGDHAYEALYFVILSYVGERLDEKGLHRVHGLGVRVEGKGMLCLGASGTGKSTLAVRLLRQPNSFLLSDDTPILVRHGEMRAFPERIALKERPPPKLSVRKFRRAQYGEKFVVGAECFTEKVIAESDVDWILLLKRQEKNRSIICPLSRAAAVPYLLKWLVLGYETPQIWELYLRLDPRDWLKKTRILFSRSRVAWDVIKGARFASFELSSSPELAARALRQLARLEASG